MCRRGSGGDVEIPGAIGFNGGCLEESVGGERDEGWDSRPAISGVWESEPSEQAFSEPEQERYERRGVLGEGGMGRVISVLDRRLRREVALKEVRVEVGPAGEARLAREAWITAQLEHPSIVPVHDAGRTEQGRLFYTMRLVRGASLALRISQAEGVKERLRLLRPFLDACQAVAYAHSTGIVHRDLKPANILMGEFGETQVVDWGLARPIRRDGPWMGRVLDDSDLSQVDSGRVVGTPAYMSPEQAAGEVADERSDVWGLGAILHELLSGRPPYSGGSGREVLKQVTTTDPEPLPEGVPSELAAIAERAMMRDPAARYPNAQGMAQDLVRYLDGRTVEAYDYRPADHLRRFLRARRVPVLMGGVAALLLAGIGFVGAQRTAAERDRAVQAEAVAARALEEADSNLALALRQQAQVSAERGDRPRAEVLAAHSLRLEENAAARGVLARFGGAAPERLEDRPSLEHCRWYGRVRVESQDQLLCRDASGLQLWSMEPDFERLWSKAVLVQELVVNTPRAELAVVSPEFRGELVVLGLEDGRILRRLPIDGMGERFVVSLDGETLGGLGGGVLDAESAELLGRLSCSSGLPQGVGAFRDGFVYACSDEALRYWEPGDRVTVYDLDWRGRTQPSIHHLQALDAQRLVVTTFQGELGLVDLSTQQVLHWSSTGAGRVHDLTPVGDGSVLAIAAGQEGVRFWHVATGQWVGRLPTGPVSELRVEGDELLTVGERIQRWRLPELSPQRVFGVGGFTGVEVSPDGSAACGAMADGSVRAFDLPGLEEWPSAILGGSEVAKDCGFSPDGVLLGVGISVHGVQRLSREGPLPPLEPRPGIYTRLRRVVGLRDHTLGLSYAVDGPELWTGVDPVDQIRVPGREFTKLGANHAGDAAALLDSRSGLYRLRLDQGLELEPLGVLEDWEPASLDIGEDADLIVVGGAEQLVRMDLASGERRAWPVSRPVQDLAISPDDRLVAAGERDGVVEIFDLATGDRVAILRGHSEVVASVAFSPDGRSLVTGSWDGNLQLWNLSDLRTPADTLVERAEATWDLSLEQALAASE